MAGLPRLARKRDDVLEVVALDQLLGVKERITGKRCLDATLVQDPTYARPNDIREYMLDLE